MSSASGTQKRTRTAGLALLASLTVAAALAGCKGTSGLIELQPPRMIARRSKAYWRDVLSREDQSWSTLEARCNVTIRNPQIDTAPRTAPLTGGRIVVQKPDRVYLRVPDSGDLQLLLVGDGQSYRTEMPVFRDSYSGPYDEPVVPQQGRVHVMPADIAHAFCPVALLTGRAPVLNEGERMSTISAIQWVEEPPAIRLTAAITLDRTSEAIMAVEKYDDDGGIRARITYPRRTSVELADGQSVRVPVRVLIDYPTEQTRILLDLENVKLNEPLEGEGMFAEAP